MIYLNNYYTDYHGEFRRYRMVSLKYYYNIVKRILYDLTFKIYKTICGQRLMIDERDRFVIFYIFEKIKNTLPDIV